MEIRGSGVVVIGEWLERWGLDADGEAISTPSSALLPVRRGNARLMLKVAHEEEERRGAALMPWWDGDGAVRVVAHEGDALLMERADGARSLLAMSKTGQDDEASRILCAVAAKLHRPRPAPPELVPLERWFRELAPGAKRWGGVLREAQRVAEELLADPRDVRVLHGDLHHGNVLDGGEQGWLAIDPKGLIGERGFDFANIFSNPDEVVATAPGRLARQVDVVADSAGLERERLLRWIVAYTGLSAVWSLGDDGDAGPSLTVVEMALAALSS